jgi:putative flippase GtrA
MTAAATLEHQERFKICGHRVPQYFWFVVSGALCDVFQALIDYIVYHLYVYEWERATVCWTVGYTLSIILRHTSHRFLVFGDYEGSYCSSLGRTYLAYSASIVLSMFSNHYIINILKLSHRDAWIITMLWTGLLNYFLLKASWKGKHSKSDEAEDSKLMKMAVV